VLTALLPVLDDLGRAREHGELTGGFKAIAESLERTVMSLGLAPFGEVGDAFDPHRHEALMHSYADDVSAPVCRVILQVGYQFGERVIRPARVAVAEPTEASATEPGAVPGEAVGAAPTEAGGAETGGTETAGTETAGTEVRGAEAGGAEAGGAEAGTSPTDGESVSESSGAAGHGAQTS
ncbi:MAG: nucleotide exchange factor GrpE, partial [Nocardioidaceae bacterium]|nr:nucleotide exchange factor GrpE [Nocardioidaceae bacterium]